MSRRSGRRRQRDALDIASDPTPSLLPRSTPVWPLRDIEDRRTWHPEGEARPARSFRRSGHRLTVSEGAKRHAKSVFKAAVRPDISNPFSWPSFRIGGLLPSGIKFYQSPKVIVCVRRKQRREVLHALRKTGGGGRARRRRRRNFYSGISC